MPRATRAPEKREEALSRERIIAAAVELLDAEGEQGLTFRALATHLATGAGAIYWHIANKSELLGAATDEIVVPALDDAPRSATPEQAIVRIALGVFEAIDAHPWVGSQLSRTPWEAATMQIFERIGRQVQALGARPGAQFSATSALVSYIIGVSVQNAAQGRTVPAGTNRTEYLAREAARWKALDAEQYPFTRSLAPALGKHDDRAEFLAGVDLFLAGIAALTGSRSQPAATTRAHRAKHRS